MFKIDFKDGLPFMGSALIAGFAYAVNSKADGEVNYIARYDISAMRFKYYYSVSC